MIVERAHDRTRDDHSGLASQRARTFAVAALTLRRVPQRPRQGKLNLRKQLQTPPSRTRPPVQSA